MFNLPADIRLRRRRNVPGLLMKESEQTRGAPLSGLAVKVTNNFFLIGLSAAEADMQRNLQLLKERAWFDIPGRLQQRAPRDPRDRERQSRRARVHEAFAAWKQ